MYKFFYGTEDNPDIEKLWPLSDLPQQVVSTLQEASQHAIQSGCSIIASYSYPLDHCEPLTFFTAATQAGLEVSFYWEQPVKQQALVGIGTATTIETHGTSRFSDAISARDELLRNAVIQTASNLPPACEAGPVFFGGFAF